MLNYWFRKIKFLLKEYSKKTLLGLKDLGSVLFSSTADNYFRVESCRKEQDGNIKCTFSGNFRSYRALKKFQKRLRLTTFTSSTVITLVVLSSLLTQIFNTVPNPTHAAVASWTQTDWGGGVAPSEYANNDDHKDGEGIAWTKFASTTGPIVADSEKFSFVAGDYVIVDDSDTDFALGTINNTSELEYTSGGDSSVLQLKSVPQAANFIQTTNSNITPNISTTGGFNNVTISSPEIVVNPSGTSGADANLELVNHSARSSFPSGGTNHNGSTWYPSDGSTISGTHYNISTFKVFSGRTVYADNLKVQADDMVIDGTLSASGKGGAVRYIATGLSQYPRSGSHGGEGGCGWKNAGAPPTLSERCVYEPAEPTFGSNIQPTTEGQGGIYKNISSPNYAGNGGGVIRLDAINSLAVNGPINADGINSTAAGYSAGAGGSIWITAKYISGNGQITAKGGDADYCGACNFNPPSGHYLGPGGGGGRIAIEYSSDTHSGAVSVAGGQGFSSDAGTIYYKSFPDYNSATYTSYVDAGIAFQNVWNSLSWEGLYPNGTGGQSSSLSFKVKSHNLASAPTFTAGTYCSVSSQTSNSSLTLTDTCRDSTDQYLWYQATLNTPSDGTETPDLNAIDIGASIHSFPVSSTYESKPFLAAGNIGYTTTTYDISPLVNGENVEVRVRTFNLTDGSDNPIDGPNGFILPDWADCDPITSGEDISSNNCVIDEQQRVQYQVKIFSSSDRTSTPSVDSVEIGFERVGDPEQGGAEGSLISSWYNSGDEGNVFNSFYWHQTETMPPGSSVEMYVRTAPILPGDTSPTDLTDDVPDVANATEWMGPNAPWVDAPFTDVHPRCATSTVVGPPAATKVFCTVDNAGLAFDGSGDYFMQYKIKIVSTLGYMADVSEVGITYEVNKRPVISGGSDLDVGQNYDLEDSDFGKLMIGSYEGGTHGFGLSDDDDSSATIYYGIDLGLRLSAELGYGTDSFLLTNTNANDNNANPLKTSDIYIQIDEEQILCSGRTGYLLEGCSREINNSLTSVHSINSTVWIMATSSNLSGDYGPGIGTTTTDSLSAVWDFKNDVSTGVYYDTAILRVVANDGRTAKQVTKIDGAISSPFIIDTTKPNINNNKTSVGTYDVIKVDGRQFDGSTSTASTSLCASLGAMNANEVCVTIKANDDSDIYYRYSATSSLDGSGLLVSDGLNGSSATWIADNNTKTATGVSFKMSIAPETTTKQASVYVQFMDEVGNVTNESSADIYVSTPERPSGVMIQDITNTFTTPNEEGLFITWKRSSMEDEVSDGCIGVGCFAYYEIEKAVTTGANPTDNDFQLYAQLNPSENYLDLSLSHLDERGTNYYRDNDVIYTGLETYFYRIVTVDQVGNRSYYSVRGDDDSSILRGIANGTQDPGEGGGGVSSEGPSLTYVSASPTSGEATITWTSPADQLSDSAVDYVDEAEYLANNFTNAITVGNATMVDYHEVTIKGLTPGETYYFRIKSTNNTGGNTTQETDTNHPGGFSFATTNGVNIVPGSITASGLNGRAIIEWETDIPASSYVVYSDFINDGIDADNALVNPNTFGSDTLVSQDTDGDGYINHTVELSGLGVSTYKFFVRSIDAGSILDEDKNVDVNGATNYYEFTTTNDQTAPELDGSIVEYATHNKAYISWRTNVLTHGSISYGTSSLDLIRETFDYNIESGILLEDLEPNTTYNYVIDFENKNLINATSSPQSFTTDSSIYEPIVFTDHSALEAMITDTDALVYIEPAFSSLASSTLCFHENNNQGVDGFEDFDWDTECSGGANPNVIEGAGITKTHYYKLINKFNYLKNYSYKIKVDDFYNETSYEYQGNFKTLERQVSHTSLQNIIDFDSQFWQWSGSEVMVNFKTDALAKSFVCYLEGGASDLIDADTKSCINGSTKVDSPTGSIIHVSKASNLTVGSLYSFQALAIDEVDNTIVVKSQLEQVQLQQEADPDPIGSLSLPVAEGISDTDAIVTFSTDVDATSYICYSTSSVSVAEIEDNNCSSEGFYRMEIGAGSATKLHAYHIKDNLLAGTTYYLRARAAGSANNASPITSNEVSFAMASVQVVPTITQITNFTDSLTSPNSAVITFITDALATSTLCISEAPTEIASTSFDLDCLANQKYTKTDSSKTHSYTISSLTPSTNYNMMARVTDAGNGTTQLYTSLGSFSTEASVVPHLDLVSIENMKVPHKTDDSALVTFTTNNDTYITTNASSTICYALDSVTEIDSFNPNTADITDFNVACAFGTRVEGTVGQTHYFLIESLTIDTAYSVIIAATDEVDSGIHSFEAMNFITDAEVVNYDTITIEENIDTILVSDTKAIVTMKSNIETYSTLCQANSSISVDGPSNNFVIGDCDLPIPGIAVPTKNHTYELDISPRLNASDTGLNYAMIRLVNPDDNADIVYSSNTFSFASAIRTITNEALANPGTPDSDNLMGVTTDSATLSFTANTPHISVIYYATSSVTDIASAFVATSSTPSRNHIFKLEGLEENQQYYYRIKSIDAQDSSIFFLSPDSVLSTFSTLESGDTDPPLITVGPSDSSTIDSATISFTTNEASIATILYVTQNNLANIDTSPKEEASTQQYRATHNVEIDNLIQNQVYRYKIRIQDQLGNEETYPLSGDPFTFTTEQDETAPVISSLSYTTATSSATITWKTTGDLSNTKMEWGETISYGELELDEEDTIYHVVNIDGLVPGNLYFFRVSSEDLSGNIGSTTNQFALPLSEVEIKEEIREETIEEIREEVESETSGGGMIIIDKTDKVAPVISDVKVAELGDFYALITWTTDEPANSTLFYGLSSEYSGAVTNKESILENTTSHTVLLKNLVPLATYHFSAVSIDDSGNVANSPDYSFTTREEGSTEDDITPEKAEEVEESLSKIQELAAELLTTGQADESDIKEAIAKMTAPPLITGDGPEVHEITSKSALILWATDRRANSVVSYFKTEEGVESARQVGNFEELVNDHQVRVTGLDSGTDYTFIGKSTDVLGNVGASDPISFTTEIIPFISKVSILNIKSDSVEIDWYSNTQTTSLLEYGADQNYGKDLVIDISDYTLGHHASLGDLSPGTTYHFRVKGYTRAGDVISSDDYTFTTLSNPDVLGYSIENITDKSATISWTTSQRTTSEVEYINSDTSVSDTVANSELTLQHSVVLKNLNPGVKYDFLIRGSDEFGQVTESELFSFTTLVDTQAPIIEYVKTDMALISKGQEDGIQVVITWKTDEISSSEVIYAEGVQKDISENEASGSKVKVVKAEGGLTNKHVLVVTDFRVGSVYTIKAKSIDEAGNVSYSKKYTVLTPQKEESVLQVIIKTFEDTFGWLNLGG
ncbi:hypothetical protein C0584_04995 [Candidatus Parcubacteria bacterium]|nr:MAG: hypothetical protein C0584_04995 [Candidatus Parcubacteria bacterium]